MVLEMENTKEKNLRDSMYGRMHLNARNRRMAKEYLNMENEEDPSLLAKVLPQDLTVSWPSDGYATYLKWLYKNKRTEELSRYVRFVVKVGGSTAWWILVNDNYEAKLSDLEVMLDYLTGEYAQEQKMALRAALCAKHMRKDGNVEEARKLLAFGKKDPETFGRTLQYYHCGETTITRDKYAKELVTAMYLYWKEEGTTPDLTHSLIDDLLFWEIRSMTYPARAYSESEIETMQNYVRNADADTPFPQEILSICSARNGWMNVTFLAGCAFLALRHSVRFELLFRLTLGHGFSYKYHIDALDTVRALTDDGFHARMDLVEEMLPISDADYIIWCLYGRSSDASAKEQIFLHCSHAECEAEIQRMAVKNPDCIREAAKKADSEEYRKLIMLIQHANPVLFEELHASYREFYLEKVACELATFYFDKYDETAKQYLAGKCTLDELIAEWNQNNYSIGSWQRVDNARINSLKGMGESAFYRRVLVLQLLKGTPGYFQKYSVFISEIREGSSQRNRIWHRLNIWLRYWRPMRTWSSWV